MTLFRYFFLARTSHAKLLLKEKKIFFMAFKHVALNFFGGPHAAWQTLIRTRPSIQTLIRSETKLFPLRFAYEIKQFLPPSPLKSFARRATHMMKLFRDRPKQIYHQKREQVDQQILCTFL